MGATAKRLIPQRIQSLTEPGSLPTLPVDSPMPVWTGDIKEVRRLLQFLPVIVLISECSTKDRAIPRALATESKIATTQRDLLGLLGKAVQPLNGPNPASEFAFGDVIVNFTEMTVCRKGQPVALTTKEFKALKYLIQNARRVISREELLNEVWGYENYPCTRTVDNHILRLRHKLEKEPSRPAYFRTVHGAGYKFLP